ncbi:MAG: hypothetical protein GQ569_04970, partial [Methylococcaceae bacterium]|nr:hypothetical protein [Methylococcaceae bacterium]
MKNQEILEKFYSIRVFQEKGKVSLHKPVLLLYALAQCWDKRERLLTFDEMDKGFKKTFLTLNLDGNHDNSYYPFGKLENDGIWEITESKTLKRTSVGHLFKKELLDKNITAGFTEEIYQTLLKDNHLLLTISNHLLKNYFPTSQHDPL